MSQRSQELDDAYDEFDYYFGPLMSSLLFYNQHGNVVFAPMLGYRDTMRSQNYEPYRRSTTRNVASQLQNVRPTMINANERTRVNDPGGATQISPILISMPSPSANNRRSEPVMTQPINSTNLQEDQSTSGCLICFEDFSSEGKHRVVSLNCGHIFGKSCIERWLRNHSTCPSCKVTVSDIRLIFGFPIVNSSEVNQMREELKRLQDENDRLTLLRNNGNHIISSPRPISTETAFAMSLKKAQTNECIVSAINMGRTFNFSPDGTFVVANFEFPYGIQKISLNESTIQGLASHNHAVRCIKVCPFNNDLIASVSEVDKRLNIYKSTLSIHDYYILDNQCSAFCWESETKLVVGLYDGTLQRIDLEIENVEEFGSKTDEPILEVFYDTKHHSFFVGTMKGVYAYRNGIKHLARDQVQSFQYDSASNCFLITSWTETGTKFQLFKALFNGAEITSIKIREYISLSKVSVSTFWTAPNNYFVCLFFDETQCITRIFNWGKSDDLLEVRPKYERSFKLVNDNGKLVKYGYLKRNDQYILAIMTESKLHQYLVEYEK